ncbi:hypothetical protein BLA29_009685, partial [Euroglyphus maynei]
MLKVADFWLRYVDGLYLKNLEQIHVDDDDNDKIATAALPGSTKREKILLEFLQRLRRISDYHDQLYAKKHKLTSLIKVPKKILICSSHLLSPLLAMSANRYAAAKKRRRQTTNRSLLSNIILNYPQRQRPPMPHNNQHEF